MKNLIETKYRACEGMDERERAICSWATEDGIIIDRETVKSRDIEFLRCLLVTLFFSLSKAVVVLTRKRDGTGGR